MVVCDDISDDRLLIGMVYTLISAEKTACYPISWWGTWCRSCESRTALTFGVQEFGEPQVLLRQVEGVLQVVVSVGLLQLSKSIRSGLERSQALRMKDMKFTKQTFWCRWSGAVTCVCEWGRWKPFHHASWCWSCGCWRWDSCETQTRAVRYQGLEHVCVFILDVHPPCGLHLAPQKQRVLGWAFLFIVFCLYADVLDLLHTPEHSIMDVLCISLTIIWWKCDAMWCY